MERVIFLTAGELRMMLDKLPYHYKPDTKLVVVANDNRIKLLDPIHEEGTEPERGKVLAYLKRTTV